MEATTEVEGAREDEDEECPKAAAKGGAIRKRPEWWMEATTEVEGARGRGGVEVPKVEAEEGAIRKHRCRFLIRRGPWPDGVAVVKMPGPLKLAPGWGW